MRGFLPLGCTSYHEKDKNPANPILTKKFRYMGYKYINPNIVADTMDLLQEYKKKHPQDKTPMANACSGEPLEQKARYVRAAQRLGWKVTRSQGHVYENGILVW